MTYREIEARLGRAGMENARGEARMLVAHYTGMSPATLLACPDEPLPDADGSLLAAVCRREQGYPLQYLLGSWGFWRQEYEVSPDCLIPRADTETLLAAAVERLPSGARVLELCTGSGCIAVSLSCERPDVCVTAVELYPATLDVARRNARRNGADERRLRFLQGDVLRGDFLRGLGTFDAIVSNPPYIATARLDGLQREVSFEPRAALDGGADGLDFYRRMLQQDYRAVLTKEGQWLFEIGYDQAEELRALADAGRLSCRILQDACGLDRVAILSFSHTLE